MTTRKTDLAELVAFNDWATGLLLDAVVGLSSDEWRREVGGSFGTIQRTVAHAVAAEWIWFQRWVGNSPSSAPDWVVNGEADALRQRWETIASERTEWLGARAEEDLEDVLEYRRLDGSPSATRLDLLIRHVVNHSTYHRGQVAAFLRTLGRTPPSTDLVLWDRIRSRR